MRLDSVTNPPVVQPLPPMDFRLAATMLDVTSRAVHNVAQTTSSLLGELDDPEFYKDRIAENRHELAGELAKGRFATPVSQAQAAVTLLENSMVEGADGFASIGRASILEPLTQFVATWGDADATALTKQQISDLCGEAGELELAIANVSAELQRTPQVVLPPANS